MFTRFAEFRLVRSRRIAPGPRHAVMHCNDNLPGFRRPATAGRRRIPYPALACHWFVRDGRLECGWHAETNSDAPLGDLDDHQWRTTRRVARPEWCCAGVTRAAIQRRLRCSSFQLRMTCNKAGERMALSLDPVLTAMMGRSEGRPKFFGGSTAA
jgi:hypothetical protein